MWLISQQHGIRSSSFYITCRLCQYKLYNLREKNTNCTILHPTYAINKFQTHFCTYQSVVGVNKVMFLVKGLNVSAFIVTIMPRHYIMFYAEIGWPPFTNLKLLLTSTVKLYGLKCIWKLIKLPFQWRIMENYT